MICKWIVSPLLLIISSGAYATCSFIDGGSGGSLYLTSDDIILRISTSSYSGGGLEAPFRSNVASALRVGSTATPVITCNGNEDLFIGGSELPLGTKDLFSVPGVTSYNIQHKINNVPYPNNGMVDKVVVNSGLNGEYSINELILKQGSVLELRKQKLYHNSINAIVSPYKAFTISTSDGLDILDVYVNSYNIIRESGCSLSSGAKSLDVDLGTAYQGNLINAGAVVNETPFSIEAACYNTAVHITFDGNTDNTFPSVFTNSSGDGYAKNVGVQIKKDDVVISPGEPFFMKSFSANDSYSVFETEKFNLSAQLFSLGGTTPGGIDIPLVFTLSYD